MAPLVITGNGYLKRMIMKFFFSDTFLVMCRPIF